MNFEIVDLGIDHPDYFPGFGVAHTGFTHCCYGIGMTAQEAYENAIEEIACVPDTWPLIQALPDDCDIEGIVDDDDDIAGGLYYHVGIRWNV